MRIAKILFILLVVSMMLLPSMTLAFNENESSAIVSKMLIAKTQLENKETNELFTPLAGENNDERLNEILAKWKEKQTLKWKELSDKPFIVNASAYTASADECGNNKGITASGLKTLANRTLACPPSYPFGAKIEIEGMGTYVCEDRGGAIKGNHVDIYMETKKEAFAFGRQNLMARVILE